MSARTPPPARRARWLAAAALLLLAACSGKEVPVEHRDLIGQWESPELRITITSDGIVDYARTQGGTTVTLNGPIESYRDDGITAGYGPFKDDIKINERPSQIDEVWWMTVDGVPVHRIEAARFVGDRRD